MALKHSIFFHSVLMCVFRLIEMNSLFISINLHLSLTCDHFPWPLFMGTLLSFFCADVAPVQVHCGRK